MQNNYVKDCSRPPPDSLTNLSMVILKGKIFLNGGIDNRFDLPAELWQYDIHWKSWLNIDKHAYMAVRQYFSQIFVEDKWIYLVGCEDDPDDDQDRVPHITIARFDSEKFRWEFLTDIGNEFENSEDIPREVTYIFYYCHALYIFADIFRERPTNILFKYSIIGDYWTLHEQNGNMPKMMFGISGSVFDNKYYCFGEKEYSTTKIFQVIFILDLITYEWCQKNTYPDFDQYPSNRIFASLTFFETCGYLSGGQSESNETLDDLWSIDLRTLKWHKFNLKLENKIIMHTSAIYRNTNLYLFGGIINNIRVNRLQKYILEIPTLYKLCLYVLIDKTKEESELEDLPIYIRQDIIIP